MRLRVVSKTLIVISLFFSFAVHAAEDEVDWSLPINFEGIFILDESEKDLFQQCARESIETKIVWRPTFEQVKIVDSRLRAHLKKTKSNFKVLPKKIYHRQYIGYTDDKGESIYVNVYPVTEQHKKDEARHGIVSCEKSRLYWGISFSLETFEFSKIDFNDQLVIPLAEPAVTQ